jgi:peptide/nickel transport system substrate-binding protein
MTRNRKQAPSGRNTFLLAACAVALACSRDRAVPSPVNNALRPGRAAATAPKTPPGAQPAATQGNTGNGIRPSYGGTLRVHLGAHPPHLNPLLGGHDVIQQVVAGLVYESLVECRGEEMLARLGAWDHSVPGHLLFRLRDDAIFHDGRILTPGDVRASVGLALESGHPPALRELVPNLGAVDELPGRVVRFRLRRPSYFLLRALCEVPILPATGLVNGPDARTQLGAHPVGTGPFRFVAWERGKHIRLVRARPRGAATGAPPSTPGAVAPEPYLDEIVFEIETDGTRALVETRRGAIDVLPEVVDVHVPEQVAAVTLADELHSFRLTPDRYSLLALNHRHKPLDDLRLRRALSQLWDRANWAQTIHRGLARPLLTPPYGHSFDPDAAGRALDAAGYRDTDADGVRDRNKIPLRITLLKTTQTRHLDVESQKFARALRRAGILLDIETVAPDQFWWRLGRGEFALAPVVWQGRLDEEAWILFGPQGALKFMRYQSAAMSAALARLEQAGNAGARAPAFARIAQVLAREQPAIFLYRHDVLMLVSKRVHGLAATGAQLDLRGVWVDPLILGP